MSGTLTAPEWLKSACPRPPPTRPGRASSTTPANPGFQQGPSDAAANFTGRRGPRPLRQPEQPSTAPLVLQGRRRGRVPANSTATTGTSASPPGAGTAPAGIATPGVVSYATSYTRRPTELGKNSMRAQ